MEDHLKILLALIPLLPLGSAILTAILGVLAPELRKWIGIPTVLALAIAFGCSLSVVTTVHQPSSDQTSKQTYEKVFRYWTWMETPGAYQQTAGDSGAISHDFRIEITLRADALTAIMLAMVTFVSLLVAIFSIGYMHGDPGQWRFFSYVSLFVFSMTMLVSVSNFLLLYVFWEAVGVCSYLLIGFWYQRPAAAAAGKKAFLVNRVGDFGFALGIFLIWTTYWTLDFHDQAAVSQNETQQTVSAADAPRGILSPERIRENDYHTGMAPWICLLLFLGACGKSAQFPLHVWLPDAMEGPTPVSALIHAATMVTAGVYMVARCTPLFTASPPVQVVVACIGVFTALLAALIALTQNDLKRVLAYSTVSQLGFMFLALGAGTLIGITAAMFHLFTHAFFKALLFLGAGSVMHAMGNVIDMRRFGGLRRRMPITHWTFLAGCLALAGVPIFAGYWSKDAILLATYEAGQNDSLYTILFGVAIMTAFLTAFYTTRAYVMTFHGPEQIPSEAGDHAHESPPSMWIPLAVLAVLAVFVGWIAHGPFIEFLQQTPSLAALEKPSEAAASVHGAMDPHKLVPVVATLTVLGGIGLAAFLYFGEDQQLARLTAMMNGDALARLSDAQWIGHHRRAGPIARIHQLAVRFKLGWLTGFIGGMFQALSVFLAGPLLLFRYLSPYRLSYNKFFIDEIYQALIVAPLRLAAAVSYWFDQFGVDRLVNFCGWIPVALGGVLRRMQTGLVQFYALAMLLGALVLLAAAFLWTTS